MNKSLIFAILIICCVASVPAETIPVAVQSHRNFDVRTIQLDREQTSPVSSHVFEIEPIQAPLRIIFSSESSPLFLDVERRMREEVESKQDRSGADMVTDKVAKSDAGAIDDDEYTIVDQFERVVPVRVRDSIEEVLPTEQKYRRVVLKPAVRKNTAKLVNNQKPKKETKKAKSTTKAEKLTTAKVETETTVTEASVEKSTAKFGARISRNADKKVDKKSKKV